MTKSFGEALANGVPIIFTREGSCPEVICEPGKESQALETMEKMGLIKLLRPHKGTIPGQSGRIVTDKEILEENGWTVECVNPPEFRHKDGSLATGAGARMILKQCREGLNP